jgi:hypothetical protein
MAQWVDIPLAVTHGKHDADGASYVSDVELVNLMLRENPPGSRTPFHIAQVPALSTLSNEITGTGLIRGLCFQRETGALFMVRGTTVYYKAPTSGPWTAVPTGTMPGTEWCRMIDAGTHIVAVDGTNARAITTLESFACSRGNFSDVTYQDGYTIFTEEGSNSLYVSDLDDPTTIGALNFTTVDATPGDCVGVVSDHRELFVFKTGSIEYYQNAGISGFPFVRSSPGIIERGTYNIQGSVSKYGRATIAKYDNAIFWVGDNLRVYRMQGYQPVAISTPQVERFIDRWLDETSGGTNRRLFGTAFVLDGDTYYALSGLTENTGLTTLVCDVKRGVWHRRESPLNSGAGVSITHAVEIHEISSSRPLRKVIVAAINQAGTVGGLHYLDVEGTNDSNASSQTTRTMTLPQFAPGGGRRTFMPELYLDMQKASTSGTLSLQWSDDGGANYNSAVSGTATLARVRWQRLGSFFQRVFKFTFEIASKLQIMGVRARVEVGE